MADPLTPDAQLRERRRLRKGEVRCVRCQISCVTHLVANSADHAHPSLHRLLLLVHFPCPIPPSPPKLLVLTPTADPASQSQSQSRNEIMPGGYHIPRNLPHLPLLIICCINRIFVEVSTSVDSVGQDQRGHWCL